MKEHSSEAVCSSISNWSCICNYIYNKVIFLTSEIFGIYFTHTHVHVCIVLKELR